MGLQLPPELAEALNWVGFTWPEADEELLVEAAQAWTAFAGTLRAAGAEANSGAATVGVANRGRDVTAFDTMWRGEEGPTRRIDDGAEAAELIAAALLVMAVITLTQKILTIVQLIIVVVQVAMALAAAAPTLGGSLAQIPVAIGVARVAIRRIIKEVVDRVVNEIIPRLLRRAKTLLRRFTRKPGRGPGRPPKVPGPLRDIRYQGKPMLDKYRYETMGDHPGNPFRPSSVRRLDEAQLEQHRVYVDSDGIMRSARDGQPFDTRNASTHWSQEGGRAIFVMDERGNIYASTYQEVGKFHHSTLGNGRPVAAAGEIAVVDGKVQYVTSASGHYQPTPQHMRQVTDELGRNGVNNVPLFGFDGRTRLN
ncbi:WXG100-like domain-containing protein [Micromonospora maritima]|uniref:Outer membrane channel protein CpnT-like N-terminal domain-containing protein n=1 Tax=Micromonospora maritima TaxID=986711 RepID=A0ABW7ZHC4_9ACTN